jgi:hypothetical protein
MKKKFKLVMLDHRNMGVCVRQNITTDRGVVPHENTADVRITELEPHSRTRCNTLRHSCIFRRSLVMLSN